VKQDFTDTE